VQDHTRQTCSSPGSMAQVWKSHHKKSTCLELLWCCNMLPPQQENMRTK